jgi:hypothetical protein
MDKMCMKMNILKEEIGQYWKILKEKWIYKDKIELLYMLNKGILIIPYQGK